MNGERFNNVDEALTNPEAKRMDDEQLDQEYANIEADGFRRESIGGSSSVNPVATETTPSQNKEQAEVEAYLDRLDAERGQFNNVDKALDNRTPESLDSGFDSYAEASYENEQYIDSVMAEAFEDVAKVFKRRIEERRNRLAGATALETQSATNATEAKEQAQTSIGGEVKTGTDN